MYEDITNSNMNIDTLCIYYHDYDYLMYLSTKSACFICEIFVLYIWTKLIEDQTR